MFTGCGRGASKVASQTSFSLTITYPVSPGIRRRPDHRAQRQPRPRGRDRRLRPLHVSSELAGRGRACAQPPPAAAQQPQSAATSPAGIAKTDINANNTGDVVAQSSGSQTITGDIADRVLEPGASIPTPEEAAEAALAAAAAAVAIALAGARNPVRDPSRVFKPPSPNVPMSTRDAFAEATSVYETAGLVLPDFIPDDEPLPYVWPRADQEPPPTTPTPADEWASARPVTDRSHAEASSADEPLASPSVDATATDEAVTEPHTPRRRGGGHPFNGRRGRGRA